ncbi:MAG TPA: hypothetical protein VMU43_13555, partial [Candidatus Acidoferrum sp.]|nr:hypothetical protein [Candidatus Acidoferrum sp.]
MSDCKFHTEQKAFWKRSHRAAKILVVLAAFLFALPLFAQDVGPVSGGAPQDDNPDLPQPEASQPAPQPVPHASPPEEPVHYTSPLNSAPPALPVGQI